MRADYKISFIDEDRDKTLVRVVFHYGDFELVENDVTHEMESIYVRQGVIDAIDQIFPISTSRDVIETSLKAQLASYCSLNGYETIDEQK